MDGRGHPTVGAVVLGAGASRRFGDENKLLRPVGGVPMIARVTRIAVESALDDVVVVLGHDAEAIAETLDGIAAATAYNDDYGAGQSTSVRCGVEFAMAAGWDGAVVLLGDMPFVSAETVDRLVAAYRSGPSPIVAPRYDGHRGNPVLFDRSQFERLLDVSGDRGGRELVRTHPDTLLLETGDPGVRRDIDTAGDLSNGRS